MDNIKEKFLNLFFNKGEEVCISANEFGFHSVSQEELYKDNLVLVSNNEEYVEEYGPTAVKEENINLIALNPIKGKRNDKNVTSFRSFLIEIDEGSLESQQKYIESLKVPFSVCVFSGNKSLHYGIVLKEDLKNVTEWRMLNKWMLNIVKKADQQTLNPSRCIRYPNNMRNNGKKLRQSLVKINSRIDNDVFFEWLMKFKDKKPIKRIVKKRNNIVSPSIGNIPFWIKKTISEGIDVERNNTWFKVFIGVAKIGYDMDDAIDLMNDFFEEETDFRRAEWLECAKSAYKTVGEANE